MTPFALIPVFLAVIRAAQGQDAPSYPQWVTNDYSCVVKCIEDQLSNATPPATNDQTAAALGCVRDACNKDTAQGNAYQAHYIINMFNAIGTIYEPESWMTGNGPEATDLTAPEGWTQAPVTATWTDEAGAVNTGTTTAWVPPPTAEAAEAPSDPALVVSSAASSPSSLSPSSSASVRPSGNSSAESALGNESGAMPVLGASVALSSLGSLVLAIGASMLGGVGVLAM